MTIKFHDNIRYLALGRGLNGGQSGDTPVWTTAVTVYSGTQPTAATIASNFVPYRSVSTDFLIHFPSVGWTQPLNGPALAITTFPGLTAASHTGTGSWAIIWSGASVPLASMNGAIPNSLFLVVPVSILTGTGVVKFDPSLDFVAATTYNISQGAITASST